MDNEPAIADPLETETPTRYRALCLNAVICLVLGGLSFVTAFWLPLAIVPLAGLVFGWLALRQINRAPEEWTGFAMAQWGMVLSAVFLVGGAGARWLLTSEVPYGYEVLYYDSLQPDPNKPTEPIPERAMNMDDKKVFIRGYMKPGRRQSGIKEFILCPTVGHCPFCNPKPTATEMIRVILQGDATTSYTTHQIGVAGRLHIHPGASDGAAYSLDADLIR